MTDWPRWGQMNPRTYSYTAEPGMWGGEEDEVRNDGPAFWFDDGSGGLIVEADSVEAMTETLTHMLELVRSRPAPLPAGVCVNCGAPVRFGQAHPSGVEWTWFHHYRTESLWKPGEWFTSWAVECHRITPERPVAEPVVRVLWLVENDKRLPELPGRQALVDGDPERAGVVVVDGGEPWPGVRGLADDEVYEQRIVHLVATAEDGKED